MPGKSIRSSWPNITLAHDEAYSSVECLLKYRFNYPRQQSAVGIRYADALMLLRCQQPSAVDLSTGFVDQCAKKSSSSAPEHASRSMEPAFVSRPPVTYYYVHHALLPSTTPKVLSAIRCLLILGLQADNYSPTFTSITPSSRWNIRLKHSIQCMSWAPRLRCRGAVQPHDPSDNRPTSQPYTPNMRQSRGIVYISNSNAKKRPIRCQ